MNCGFEVEIILEVPPALSVQEQGIYFGVFLDDWAIQPTKRKTKNAMTVSSILSPQRISGRNNHCKTVRDMTKVKL